MKIVRHRVEGDGGPAVSFQASPNRGDVLEPRYLVMHYTAGRGADESVSWLCNPASRASAHLVIGRDGTITQLVPFDRVSWHAGVSQWDGIKGLNQHSIGIELDNAGRLTRQGGRWRAWFGTEYPDEQVMEATHKHETAAAGWHIYTPEQIESALAISTLLMAKYDLKDVVGHEDISPGRKSDPGPAFPLESFRARLLGRAQDQAELLETTTAVNIREGPGTAFAKLPASPLPAGTRVELVRDSQGWRLVDLVDEVGGDADVQGWVRADYLRRLAP
jgi:N-acetylmuramoyl-L-alanine amidase